MQALETAAMKGRKEDPDGRHSAMDRCNGLLTREGFTVSSVPPEPNGTNTRLPDLIASDGLRFVRVFVLTAEEVDAPGTRTGLGEAVREGETRVYAPWALRWRARSNLDRWELDGISVGGW